MTRVCRAPFEQQGKGIFEVNLTLMLLKVDHVANSFSFLSNNMLMTHPAILDATINQYCADAKLGFRAR